MKMKRYFLPSMHLYFNLNILTLANLILGSSCVYSQPYQNLSQEHWNKLK